MLNSFEKIGQITRIMRKIGIHLKNCIIVMGKSIFEASQVGRAEAELAGTMYHVYLWILGMDLVGEFARAIRGIVVDNEDITFRRSCENLILEWTKVIYFILGGDNNKCSHICLSPILAEC